MATPHTTASPTSTPTTQLTPLISAFSINPTTPPIFNLKDAAFATYISRSLGSPSNSTLLKAIRRGYISIRGLTTKLLLRNPPQSLFTALGHLDVVRKNLRSSKTPPFQPSPSRLYISSRSERSALDFCTLELPL